MWPEFTGLRLPAFRPVGNKNLTGGNPMVFNERKRADARNGKGLRVAVAALTAVATLAGGGMVAATAMADRDLAKAVADHKAKFFPAKDAHAAPVDYHGAVGGHLRLVPDGEAFYLLKADYAVMIEAGYLEGAAELFEALMARCGDLQERINAAA